MTFQAVADAESVWNGELVGCHSGQTPVLLIKLDDEVRAFRDRCVHLAVPLSEGRLEGSVLTCTAHDWQYDACSGRGLNPEGVHLDRFPVRIEDGRIWVDVEQVLAPDWQGEP